ncbi:DUF4148 domain-containing protein [Burkholderia sp. PAMC 26561]|uniref:DUF4148 domain-containing protein n=1 Tax=Burkholderia sp. PAMC 26561 TaxID=1795043 RepID=UPI00084CEF04|nr:DUF4148 domain-containing protein [Burkholderia sp. PAMC 26561]
MKLLVCAVVAFVALISVTSFVQSSNAPLTRRQVLEQVIQLEQVGYRASTHDSDYPRDIQAAEAKVWALNASSHSAYRTAAAHASAGVQ